MYRLILFELYYVATHSRLFRKILTTLAPFSESSAHAITSKMFAQTSFFLSRPFALAFLSYIGFAIGMKYDIILHEHINRFVPTSTAQSVGCDGPPKKIFWGGWWNRNSRNWARRRGPGDNKPKTTFFENFCRFAHLQFCTPARKKKLRRKELTPKKSPSLNLNSNGEIFVG